MNSTEIFCRFCLKEMNATNFENIEETVKTMSNILKLKMDLNISEDPVVCLDCVENLQRLHSFKVICTETENFLSPFMGCHIHEQIDLPEVYLKINENKSLGEQNICRFCMCKISSDLSIQLNTVINVTDSIKHLLEDFLQVDLTLVRDSVLCKTCHNCLRDYLIFTENCRNVEEVIKKYIETEGINPGRKISLKAVQQSVNSAVIVKQEMDHVDVKHEMQQNNARFMEVLPASLDLKSESSIPTEEFELDIKCESLDLKPILNDTERAVDSTCLRIENVKKEEGEVFNEVKNAEQLETKRKSSSKNDRLFNESSLYDLTPYKCENEDCLCKRKYKSNLSSHKDLSVVRIYQCGYDGCSFDPRCKDTVADHELVHKDISEVTIYKCEIEDCPFQTKYKQSFYGHRLVHKDISEVTIYKCKSENCPYETKRKRNLIRHKLLHKDLSEVTMYKCGYDGCSFQSKRKDSTSKHELVHKDLSEVTIYKCEIENCSFQTKYKRNLLAHRLVHKDISELTIYKCRNENCLYETIRMKNLIKHKLIHKDPSEVTIYKCKGCSFKTKYKWCLTKHKKTHLSVSSEKIPYKCENLGCSYETKYRSSLFSHKLVHKDPSEVTMYRCGSKNCLYETKYKGNLITHTKEVHKK